MKNNKSIFRREWNITGLARIAYIVVAALIIAGIVLLCIPKVGLNTGMDLSEGYAIDVTYGSEFNYAQEVKNIKGVLADKVKDAEGNKYPAINVIKHQKQGTATTDYSIRIYYKSVGTYDMDTVNKDIVTALNAELKDDASPYRVNISDAAKVSAFRSMESVLKIVSALVVTVVAALIYLMFRHKLANSLVAFVMMAVEVMLLLTLMAVTRAQLDFAFLGVVALTVCLSLFNSVIMFTRYAQYRKNPAYANKNTAYLINRTARKSAKSILLTAGVVALGGVAMIVTSLIVGGAYLGLGLSLLYSAVVTSAVGIFVMPSVFQMFNDFGKTKSKAVSKPKTVKSK